MDAKKIILKSVEYRKKILKYIVGAKAGHTGGSLSCIDILNVLYNEVLRVSPENFLSPDRDRYIQSKGLVLSFKTNTYTSFLGFSFPIVITFCLMFDNYNATNNCDVDS